MHVAIIKLGALGDVVRTLAILPGLKKIHPDLEVTWITAKSALPLVQFHPQIKRVELWDRPGNWETVFYDWVISLDDERDACRLAKRLRSSKISGAFEDEKGERNYTTDLAEWFGMGILRPKDLGGLPEANRLKLCNTATHGEIMYRALALPFPPLRPEIHFLEEHKSSALNFIKGLGLSQERMIVGLNTGAAGRWKYKSWGEEQTAELAKRIQEQWNATVILMGGAAESERNARIKGDSSLIVAPETDILTFAAIVAECDLLISSDSLAMHLGIAANIPVVSFFGPTPDAEIELFGKGEKVVTSLPCKRCYLADCEVRPHCMQDITVDQMLSAVARWISP